MIAMVGGTFITDHAIAVVAVCIHHSRWMIWTWYSVVLPDGGVVYVLPDLVQRDHIVSSGESGATVDPATFRAEMIIAL